MNEQQSFHDAMAADPTDETTRKVYADWLEDRGNHGQAARLRWWAGAMAHLRTPGTSMYAPNVPHEDDERSLPEWVARLNQVRGVRAMFHGTPHDTPGHRDRLQAAELHAYGLLDSYAFDAARRGATGTGLAQSAVRGTLSTNAHHNIFQPHEDAYNAIQGAVPNHERYQRSRTHHYDTQRLADYAHANPPPDKFVSGAHQPVKLARPAGERAPNPDVIALARAYHAKNKDALGLPEWSDHGATIRADEDLGKRAGAAFEAMAHAPNDPQVRSAYDALKAETKAQYDHATAAGYTFEPWTKPGQPYTDSADMMRDVRENKRLYYFPTDSGFGSDDRFADHPLYAHVPGTTIRYNDLFRAVHDLYAHAQHGHQFGPTGELRAWVEHARMFSPEARKALTTETHGQNSWVNFGPHEPWRTPQTERPFADQKANLLPEAVHPPVKLARPLGWIKDRVMSLFGGREPVRQPGDGIVHTRANPTAVYAEKNAVAQAIRLLGGENHTERAHQYMNWIAGFVKERPDHEIVKRYVDAAKQSGGTAGPELTAAVKPLVGVVNLLMASAGKEPRFVKPVSEATPTLPAKPLHSSSAGPVSEAVPDGPVDLSDVPAAPPEDRHTAVMRMTKEGKSRDAIIDHLIAAHGAPHRKAALASIRAAYNRALVLHQRAKGTGPNKLARVPVNEIRSWMDQIGAPTPSPSRKDETAARVLSDHMAEVGDWRHHLFGRVARLEGGDWVRHDGVAAGSHVPARDHVIPHGTVRGAVSYVFEPRAPGDNYLISTTHPRTDGSHIRVHSVLTPDEYRLMREEAQKTGTNFGPTKLAAYKGGPILPEHLTGGVAARDPYTQAGIGFHRPVEGTALAYHLRQVQKDHPHLSGAVEAALTGRSYGPSAKQDDPYVAVGKALAKLNHPLAKAHDWHAITDNHIADAKVSAFVRQHVLHPGGTDLEYWDKVRRGLATGRAKNSEQFWQRFERANTGLTREQAVEAMHRIGERELDRAYLSTIREEGLKQNADWRQVMGAHK